MLFKRISYKIALQFMGFVFLLLLVNGALFLVADFSNARRQTNARLLRTAHLMIDQSEVDMRNLAATLPPPMRDRVRIVDAQSRVIYGGGLFDDVPAPSIYEGLSDITIENEQYSVLTMPIMRGVTRLGSLQVVDVQHVQVGELPLRAFIYLLLSVAISILTFLVGLLFARHSLKPAEHMMERLEQFTQDASHELRTPLAALSSSLDLALKNKKYREGIESAKEDLREVSGLVERLLELARLDKFLLSAHTVDFSGLIEECVGRYRSLAAEKHVRVVADIRSGIVVKGDAGLLKQVLGNVLSNAIKFSKPEGGEIRVRLDGEGLSVADTGIGIPQESLPHIFNRFYQAESSRANDGFGLGLALVKRIVELHGWSITVESTVAKGTMFTVKLRK